MGAVKPGMYTNTLLLQQQMLQVTSPPPTQPLHFRHATRLRLDSFARATNIQTTMDDARNALFVLNTLVAVPSALLVADVRELRDGPVLIDVVAHLQAVWRGLSPQAPATRIDGVLSALEWLGETFGTASFPPLLARPPAIVAAAVAAGDARTIATIVHFVQARLNEADMLGGKGGEGVMLHVGVMLGGP